jgi:uncharacterized glyoxalase superfamily protein PhnB
MERKVKYIPAGYHTVTPYLSVENLKELIEFARRAFGAEICERVNGPDGEPRHVEMTIGDSHVMAGRSIEQLPAQLYLYVPDADETYRRALAAGATSLQEPATQFYGDRHGGVRDTNGIIWWIATHVEDVSPEELERRAKQAWESR